MALLKRRLAILAVTLLLLAMLAVPAYALTTQAPNLTVHSALAVENVIVDGDLLVLWRYSLPSTDWATHTVDGALAQLVQGSTIYQDRVPPVLGESMSGFYLEPGHSFTWNSTASVDLVSNPTLFTNNTSSSATLFFRSTATITIDSTADQETVCADVRAILGAVEDADITDSIDDEDYVEANTVTVAGTNVALSAFGAIAHALPGCFFLGVENGDAFDPAPGLFVSGRASTVEATAMWTRWDAFAAEYGFDNENIAAAVLGLAFAGLSIVVAIVLYQSAMFGAVTGSLVLLGGAMNAPHYLLQITFVLTMMAALMAGAFWLRGIPR